jgi:uncharacterized protein (DUF169 family)
MEWQQWSKQLTEVLGLRSAPVAIAYTDSAPSGASDGKCRACGALLKAARGEVIDLTAETSTCPGGTQYLGIRPQDPARARTLRDFLINGEKLLSCPAAIHRMMALTPAQPPFGTAEHVVFSPLASAQFPPDLAVFVVNAWQAARLVNLAVYETGMPLECDPSGSLCRAVITYPLVTGKVNISFGDVTARRSEKMAEDELFVTLPYRDLRSVVESVDKSTAGTAKSEMPPAMRRAIAESGGQPPEL